MHASIQGGLWALLLSSTGLAFASVVDENARYSSTPIAVQTDAPRPMNLVDVPTVAMATTPETSAVVASVAPLRLPPVAADSEVSGFASSLPPSTLAQLNIAFGQPAIPALPRRPQPSADAQVVFVNVVAPAAPAGPFAPMIVTQPALPEPERAVVIQRRNTAPAGNLIVRVQATGSSGGGVVTNRLPQIAPPAPVDETAPAEDVVETPDVAPAPAAPELPSFGDTTVNQLVPVEPDQAPADTAPDDVPPASDGTGGVEAEPVEPEDLTALQRYAAPFENAENLPVVGVILVDDGSFVNGPFLIFESGLTATIAMDAKMADIGLFAEAYREAGMEIAMQVALPEGATPSDVEVNFAAALDALPQASMLFVGEDDALRDNAQAARQIIDILAATQHGYVTVSGGLGGQLRAAEAADVPAATVARNLDDANGDFDGMLRILDRVAFDARRGTGAIVSATLTPEVIAILQAWSAEGIVVGPASAMMIPPEVVEEVAVEQPVVIENGLPQVGADDGAQADTAVAPQEQAQAPQVPVTEEDE